MDFSESLLQLLATLRRFHGMIVVSVLGVAIVVVIMRVGRTRIIAGWIVVGIILGMTVLRIIAIIADVAPWRSTSWWWRLRYRIRRGYSNLGTRYSRRSWWTYGIRRSYSRRTGLGSTLLIRCA